MKVLIREPKTVILKGLLNMDKRNEIFWKKFWFLDLAEQLQKCIKITKL
jgi:hypothetical protein